MNTYKYIYVRAYKHTYTYACTTHMRWVTVHGACEQSVGLTRCLAHELARMWFVGRWEKK